MSVDGNSSGRSSSNSEASPNVSFSYGPASYMVLPCYRRMTPEEDLIATLQGINLLVKQREELVNQLTNHHKKLQRSNEIESLLKFSQKIDSIMRIRGIRVMPSPAPVTKHKKPVERGVTFQWQEFKPRDLEPRSGIRSLKKVLEIDDMKKFSKKMNEKM